MNVLHEIPVNSWIKSFNKIKRSLQPDSLLLIVEDTELPIGELPNDHGFLILGEPELKALLGNKIGIITPKNERYKDRIICGIVASNEMKTLNKAKINSAIELLKSNSLLEIVKLRQDHNSNSAKLGRLYALKANNYVNSELALIELNK